MAYESIKNGIKKMLCPALSEEVKSVRWVILMEFLVCYFIPATLDAHAYPTRPLGDKKPTNRLRVVQPYHPSEYIQILQMHLVINTVFILMIVGTMAYRRGRMLHGRILEPIRKKRLTHFLKHDEDTFDRCDKRLLVLSLSLFFVTVATLLRFSGAVVSPPQAPRVIQDIWGDNCGTSLPFYGMVIQKCPHQDPLDFVPILAECEVAVTYPPLLYYSVTTTPAQRATRTVWLLHIEKVIVLPPLILTPFVIRIEWPEHRWDLPIGYPRCDAHGDWHTRTEDATASVGYLCPSSVGIGPLLVSDMFSNDERGHWSLHVEGFRPIHRSFVCEWRDAVTSRQRIRRYVVPLQYASHCTAHPRDDCAGYIRFHWQTYWTTATQSL